MKKCNVCREDMVEDAARCPHCGTWHIFDQRYFASIDYHNHRNLKTIRAGVIWFILLSVVNLFFGLLLLVKLAG